MHEIRSISAIQAAKVSAAVYIIIAAIAGVILALAALFRGHPGRAILTLFGLPILYGIAAFIFTALFCLLYNEIARRIGGIEIELSER